MTDTSALGEVEDVGGADHVGLIVEGRRALRQLVGEGGGEVIDAVEGASGQTRKIPRLSDVERTNETQVAQQRGDEPSAPGPQGCLR